jgi:hypothetical protein
MLLPPEMASDRRSHRPRPDDTRLRVGGTPPRDVRPVVAIGLCVLAVVLGWPLLRGEETAERPVPDAPRTVAPPATAASSQATGSGAAAGGAGAAAPRNTVASHVAPPSPEPRRSEPSGEPPPDGAVAHASGEQPETPSGIGLFPPPGTDPPKSGIIVPDDYELPPGYVRHYQATDDGHQLQPILMFHPDFQPVDDRGRPIKLPKDRVVPPSMAPPGLPIETLGVPKTTVPLVEHPPNAQQDPAS